MVPLQIVPGCSHQLTRKRRTPSVGQTGPVKTDGLSEFRSSVENLEGTEFSAEPLIRAAQATATGLECRIEVTVRSKIHSTWLAEFDRVIESRLNVGDSYLIEVHTDHALLLDHLDPGAELYLSSIPDDIEQAKNALVASHAAIFGERRPASRYLNPHVEVGELLAGGRGLLASGPATFVRELERQLTGIVRTSVLDRGLPKVWKPDESRFDAIGTVFLFMGEAMWNHYPDVPLQPSFVIAAGAEMRRVD